MLKRKKIYIECIYFTVGRSVPSISDVMRNFIGFIISARYIISDVHSKLNRKKAMLQYLVDGRIHLFAELQRREAESPNRVKKIPFWTLR